MKRFLTTMLVLSLFASSAHAADAAKRDAARRQLAEAVAHSDATALMKARAAFGALAAAEPEDATLQYWIGVASWRAVPLLQPQNADRAKQVCRDGLTACEKALAADPKSADALAMRASLQGLWLGFDASQMMTLGAQMEEAMGRATALAPKNPRVQFLRAIHTLHKPAFVGGGPQRAKPEFDRAVELYAADAADSPLAWGAADASLWAGRCAMQLADTTAAVAHYRRALELEPEYGWVRRVLLPQALGQPVATPPAAAAPNGAKP